MESFIDFFQSDLLSIFLKLFGIVLGFLYLFFSIIILRQVKVMKYAITVNDNNLLYYLASAQVVLALLVVGYALVIL